MLAGRTTLAAVLAASLLAGAQAESPATEEGAASKSRLVSILGREVTNREGDPVEFTAVCRIDTPVEIEYFRNGGILHTVLRNLLKGDGKK